MTQPQSVYDWTDKERAALGDEQIEYQVKVELMIRGIVPPIPPSYEDEPDNSALIDSAARTRVFKIESGAQYYRESFPFVFNSRDEAGKVMGAIVAGKLASGTLGRRSVNYLTPLQGETDWKLTEVEVMSEVDFKRIEPALVKMAGAVERNNDKRSEYDKALSESMAIEREVRACVDESKGRIAKLDRVLMTFDQYVEIQGDAPDAKWKAFESLRLAYKREGIEDEHPEATPEIISQAFEHGERTIPRLAIEATPEAEAVGDAAERLDDEADVSDAPSPGIAGF